MYLYFIYVIKQELSCFFLYIILTSSFTLDVFFFNSDKLFYKKSKMVKYLTILLMKGKKGGAKKVDWNK